ncbi:MAG: TlpA family protein disulfide reductase [Candidatus Rokubacteria bacterium]|nr:TlpA family protein disulfide reductase [Candidatus Rokubacteria bacterium]
MRQARKMSAVALSLLALLVAGTVSAAGSEVVEDLLLDLQLVPLDGQTPPPFTLEALDGKRVSLSDMRGQVVLLYFWASW